MKKLNKKGFTLIEMLVVIAIIAIMVAIIIPTVTNATEKARQATDVANIRSYIAEMQIQTLEGAHVTDTTAFKKMFTASGASFTEVEGFRKSKAAGVSLKCVAGTANNTYVITYIATLLNEGTNSTKKNEYVWTVGDMNSGSDPASTAQPTT